MINLNFFINELHQTISSMKRAVPILILFFFIYSPGKAQYGQYDNAKTVPPFKIFDNLYYVGIDWVSSYLITTDDGLILIDALYRDYPAHILQSVKELGFDPKKIKYILCTHGHYDHCEGADTLQKITNARIGMTEADWEIAEGKIKNDYANVNTRLTRDWVIHDGDSLKLGNTTIKFFETPGHTLGVLSMSFPVRDGSNEYNAFMLGGVGLNFEGVKQTELYLQSIDRIMKMKNIQVNITNHPDPGNIFQRARLLQTRKRGEPHPFVAPEDFQNWLKELKANAEKKLEAEKEKAKN
jgi:metallo-beta-lactamase class B